MTEASKAAGVGGIDPALCSRVELLHRTPGIDIFDGYRRDVENLPQVGFVVSAHVNFGPVNPRLAVDVFQYNKEGLWALQGPVETAAPGASTIVRLYGETRSRVVCLNPRDPAYRELSPDFRDPIRLSEESGQILAVAEPRTVPPEKETIRLVHSYKPNNPQAGGMYADLSRVVATPEQLADVFDVLGQAHGLRGLDLDILYGVVGREATAMIPPAEKDVSADWTFSTQARHTKPAIGTLALRGKTVITGPSLPEL